MNLLFFLTPKSEVAYVYDTFSLRQALEKMEYHQYSSIPIINKQGEYVGTLTEGDLLWSIKNQHGLNMKAAEEVPIMGMKRRADYAPVNINAAMEDLINQLLKQNFVPVIDDKNVFIGIVTRKDIIDYGYKKFCDVNMDLQESFYTIN